MAARNMIASLLHMTKVSAASGCKAAVGRPLESKSIAATSTHLLSRYPTRTACSEFSTLRRGLTGPMSARKRLPTRGLDEFRDPNPVKVGDVPIVGRPWTVPELRKKSFEDLHKLWFVLYKEKNMLLTELAISRRKKTQMSAGDRRQKVKRSMKAIKVVVGERQRLKRAALHERQVAAKREQREARQAAQALEEGSEGDTTLQTARLEAGAGDDQNASTSQ